MAFPLLVLPLVPFRNILRMLKFSDLIIISFCSQRCHNLIKWNLYKLKGWEIWAVVDSAPGIILRRGEEKQKILGVSVLKLSLQDPRRSEMNQNCCMEHTEFQVILNPFGYLTSFWHSVHIGMLECWKYVTELFQKHVSMVQFESYTTWMVHLHKVFPQAPVPDAHYLNEGEAYLNKTALAYVLEECSSENLKISGWLPPGGLRFMRFGNFRAIDVFVGLWVTVKHVTNMNCSKISIINSKWKCADANKFLRHWIYRGGMPNLEWFTIGLLDDALEEEMFDGLGEFVTRTDNNRRFRKYDEDFTFNGLEIHSKNGLVASMNVDTETNILSMAVWH